MACFDFYFNVPEFDVVKVSPYNLTLEVLISDTLSCPVSMVAESYYANTEFTSWRWVEIKKWYF